MGLKASQVELSGGDLDMLAWAQLDVCLLTKFPFCGSPLRSRPLPVWQPGCKETHSNRLISKIKLQTKIQKR